MIVVAKMYVASITETADAFAPDRVRTNINLNCVYSPDPTTENHSFWKASPNGTMRITCPPVTDIDCAFIPGQCFKVYHEQAEDGEWKLFENSLNDGRMSIKLGFQKGNSPDYWKDVVAQEEMSIDNKDVFAFYADSQVRFNVWFVPVDKEGNATGDRVDL